MTKDTQIILLYIYGKPIPPSGVHVCVFGGLSVFNEAMIVLVMDPVG